MPQYIWMPPICWDGPICLNTLHICLDASCMFGYPPYVWTPPYVWMPPICLDDVWMPAVHKQHKESMLCQTKGVSIYSLYIYMPPYVWMPTCMLGHPPVCLDDPYVWMSPYICTPPICLDTPIYLDASSVCLDTPNMFGCPICVDTPNMFGCLHIFGYIPCMFGYPHMFGCPNMFGCPHIFGLTPCKFGHPYVWMPPVCLDTPICLDAPIQLVTSKHTGVASRHVGASKCNGAYRHPLSLQNMLSLCCACTGDSQTYGGHPNIHEGVQTCEGHLTIQRGV